MKRKQHGILSVVMIFSAIVVAGIYSLYALNAPGDVPKIRVAKSIPDIPVPSAAVLHDLDRLENKLHALAQPVLSDPRPVNLIPLGYAALKRKWTDSSGDEFEMQTPFDYSLTFTFQSDRRRLCIINGEIYSEGADLPDSGNILKIGSKRVWIKKNGRKKWVPLDETTKFVKTDTK
jgi:hypothetical protein